MWSTIVMLKGMVSVVGTFDGESDKLQKNNIKSKGIETSSQTLIFWGTFVFALFRYFKLWILLDQLVQVWNIKTLSLHHQV